MNEQVIQCLPWLCVFRSMACISSRTVAWNSFRTTHIIPHEFVVHILHNFYLSINNVLLLFYSFRKLHLTLCGPYFAYVNKFERTTVFSAQWQTTGFVTVQEEEECVCILPLEWTGTSQYNIAQRTNDKKCRYSLFA